MLCHTSESLEALTTPEPNTGCWLWTMGLSQTEGGYPVIWDRGRRGYGHRRMFELVHGPIPNGCEVCHRCDNRACINPDHLFSGTRADNVRDMYNKNRGFRPHGELSVRAKLTEQDVAGLRKRLANGESTKVLAKDFGVSRSAVRGIGKRETWAHIGDEPAWSPPTLDESSRLRLARNSIPEPNTGCWLWLGAMAQTGHGVGSHHGKAVGAHRLMYRLAIGEVPPRHDVLHRCGVRSCINPDHLFAATRKKHTTTKDDE